MAVPLAYNVRNIAVRRWTTAFTMGGVAMVVAATMLLAALVGGLQRMLASTGEPDNLIVLRKGATSDGASVVPHDAVQALRALDGVARGPDGSPFASPEMLNQPFLRTQAGTRENVLVRGVEPVAFAVHRAVRLVEGRMFRPKLGEVVVGRGALGRYAPGGLGSELAFGRRRWTVVGVFDSGGTAFDSEIWADLQDVLDDTRRAGFVSGVRLRVAPGADGRALARRIEGDGRFTLQAKPEIDYYHEQAESAGPGQRRIKSPNTLEFAQRLPSHHRIARDRRDQHALQKSLAAVVDGRNGGEDRGEQQHQHDHAGVEVLYVVDSRGHAARLERSPKAPSDQHPENQRLHE